MPFALPALGTVDPSAHTSPAPLKWPVWPDAKPLCTRAVVPVEPELLRVEANALKNPA